MPIQPMYPTDRAAAAAWRALPVATQSWCREGPHRREVLPDLHLASIVAGYGETMTRRMRWLLWPAVAGFVALIGVDAVIAARFPAAVAASRTPVGVAAICCLGLIVLQFAPHLRYRRLRNWGLLAIAQVQIAAMPASVASSAGREVVAAGTTDGAAAAEIRARRRPLAYVAAIVGAAELVAVGAAGYQFMTTASLPPGRIVEVILFTSCVVVTLWWLHHHVHTPIARLTAEGWELPLTGVRGDWAKVRGIEIRAGRALGWPRFVLPPTSDVRLVVLLVDDPQHHVDTARPGYGRWDARLDCRLYGSPAVIAASRRYAVSEVEVIQALRPFTSAPVSWL